MKKVYVMRCKQGIEIKCTEKYVNQWIARGFEVVGIENSGKPPIDRLSSVKN